jgi:hypothetical protein
MNSQHLRYLRRRVRLFHCTTYGSVFKPGRQHAIRPNRAWYIAGMFRVFIDEVGNHDLKSSTDPNHRYLGLSGVIMRRSYENGQFTDALNAIKESTFRSRDVILHRREMIDADPPFHVLRDPEAREAFDSKILQLLTETTYRAFTVVIDKHEHLIRYTVWRFHPYHYCLTVLLERYVQLLARLKSTGDALIESRGKDENQKLERAYRHIYQNGTTFVAASVFQQRLTSREIKIKPKSANIAGLQLADLIASPSCRALICEKTGVRMSAQFGARIEEVLKAKKYLKNPADGKIPGWGSKWLP